MKSKSLIPVRILPPEQAPPSDLARLIEQKVAEAMNAPGSAFEPFFQSPETASEIRRHQTVAQQNKFVWAYEDWGCLVCGSKEKPRCAAWMCKTCYGRSLRRLKLSQARHMVELEEDPNRHLEFPNTAKMARAALGPAILALIGQEQADRTRALTTAEVAQEIGVTKSAIYKWVTSGRFAPPKNKLGSASGMLWLPEDVERARAMCRFTSEQVALEVGISRTTLWKWVRTGQLQPPENLNPKAWGAQGRYIWTLEDIERAKEVKKRNRTASAFFEAIKDGLQEARANGKRLGRPPGSKKTSEVSQ